jgi:hypothetical protein
MFLTGEKLEAAPGSILHIALAAIDIMIDNLSDPLDERFHRMNIKEIDDMEWNSTRENAISWDLEDLVRGYDPVQFENWELHFNGGDDEWVSENVLDQLFKDAFGGFEDTNTVPIEMHEARVSDSTSLWGTVDHGPSHSGLNRLFWQESALPVASHRLFVSSIEERGRRFDIVTERYFMYTDENQQGTAVGVFEGERWVHTETVLARAVLDPSWSGDKAFFHEHLVEERALMVSDTLSPCASCALLPSCYSHDFPRAPSEPVFPRAPQITRPSQVQASSYVYVLKRLRVKASSPYYLGEAVRAPPWALASPPRHPTRFELREMRDATVQMTGPMFTIRERHTGVILPVIGSWSLPRPYGGGWYGFLGELP